MTSRTSAGTTSLSLTLLAASLGSAIGHQIPPFGASVRFHFKFVQRYDEGERQSRIEKGPLE
jgi:hypothetical protein